MGSVNAYKNEEKSLNKLGKIWKNEQTWKIWTASFDYRNDQDKFWQKYFKLL